MLPQRLSKPYQSSKTTHRRHLSRRCGSLVPSPVQLAPNFKPPGAPDMTRSLLMPTTPFQTAPEPKTSTKRETVWSTKLRRHDDMSVHTDRHDRPILTCKMSIRTVVVELLLGGDQKTYNQDSVPAYV
ncbi:hypothetical protein AMTR_s00018p00156300 [Amborella trichopoda]|uniref:Uncharacterized protein n=1 Tax=Amborella trichopoda TaxID=13333 RepID=W1PKE4_AMBTC|nr:hypothetical protein AMTR_s00018p00156300 [Amborella trichopoda]